MHNVAQSGHPVKLLYWDGNGLCLFANRLERGRFVWPITRGRLGDTDAGAAIDAAGGDRLAEPGAQLAAGTRRIAATN